MVTFYQLSSKGSSEFASDENKRTGVTCLLQGPPHPDSPHTPKQPPPLLENKSIKKAKRVAARTQTKMKNLATSHFPELALKENMDLLQKINTQHATNPVIRLDRKEE
ncbi:MAG: hypothetical protein CM15mP9_1510 [Methanobacteriota archaeon]|nr:MAG: hypothetical protein CM15mP9_1510 [Euryarchaeota archaeon]